MRLAVASALRHRQKVVQQLERYASTVGQNIPLAKEALRAADAVCFDVDSTVITQEGIDVLADSLNKGAEVAALTQQAMEGDMTFQDALATRLDLLQPSKKDIEHCLDTHDFELTPYMKELCETLQQQQKDVYLVSGGFRLMIEPIADVLKISHDSIYANTIFFEGDGNYKGFDANEPTSADMGKPKALEMIKSQNNYKTMIMIGDGATDAQAKPPATAFIGYGGIAVRPVVQAKSDWFVTDFNDLLQVLNESD